MERETFSFQAEVNELLSLVIHSLYSNKEIFLRELVSNASDAIDKLRFKSISEPEILADGSDMVIRIRADKDTGTLVIEDTGIGMTKEELAKQLGTIAHSGSKNFLADLAEAQKKDVNLIGQFGVGFYSAYLVAERVEVTSRAAGQREAHKWVSDAKDTFSIEPAHRVERGTEIKLFLKPEHKEFLSDWRLRELVKKYSDFVAHPIKLLTTKQTGEGENAKEEQVEETLNRANALWQRSPSDVTQEQYNEFYKQIAHDVDSPIALSHFKIEGTFVFAGLLFIPRKPPVDYFGRNPHKGLRLFVKRVFILEDCEEILPPFLRFVRGVVDSDDLPLNVSREILQDSAIIRTIKKQVTKKVLDRIESLADENKDDFITFWKSFGSIVKEGIATDSEYRDRIAKMARWQSTAGEDLTTLPDYISRMKPGQTDIYFAIGDSAESLTNGPHLEALKGRGYEVLLLTDAVDEWVVDALEQFEGKKLVSAMKAGLDTGETVDSSALSVLREKAKSILGDKVAEVRVSNRLKDSPCCLVVPEHGHHGPMEQLLRASGQLRTPVRRILEVNVSHPLIQALESLREKEPESPKLTDWIETLYDQAVLTEGGRIEDPNRFARRITALMQEALKA